MRRAILLSSAHDLPPTIKAKDGRATASGRLGLPGRASARSCLGRAARRPSRAIACRRFDSFCDRPPPTDSPSPPHALSKFSPHSPSTAIDARRAAAMRADQVGVDHADGLHHNVHCRRADEFKSSFLQRLRQGFRFVNARRNITEAVQTKLTRNCRTPSHINS